MTGQYEIQNPFLAVFADQYFDLTIDQVRNCLTGLVSDNHPSRHYCTAETGVLTHKNTLRSASCSAAIYHDSQLVTDACVQSATLARRPTFSYVQENQWVYGSPNPNHLLRVFCPPNGEKHTVAWLSIPTATCCKYQRYTVRGMARLRYRRPLDC